MTVEIIPLFNDKISDGPNSRTSTVDDGYFNLTSQEYYFPFSPLTTHQANNG